MSVPRPLLNWLLFVCGFVVVFGLVLVVVPKLTRQGFSLLIYGNPSAIDAFGEEAARYTSLSHAVIGGVMVGWGVAMFIVTRTWISRSSRMGWWLVTASLVAWYIPDTVYSMASGYWQNALLNTAFAALFALPLSLLYSYMRSET